MAPKCKKGYKKVGASCVTNKSFKQFGKFADEVSIMKLAFIGAITSVGGWAIFKGIVEITGMENLNPFFMIGIGLGILVLAYKFGFKKLT